METELVIGLMLLLLLLGLDRSSQREHLEQSGIGADINLPGVLHNGISILHQIHRLDLYHSALDILLKRMSHIAYLVVQVLEMRRYTLQCITTKST